MAAATWIDVEKMPRAEGITLGCVLLDSIDGYFRNPEHQKEFEEWQQARNAKIRRFEA